MSAADILGHRSMFLDTASLKGLLLSLLSQELADFSRDPPALCSAGPNGSDSTFCFVK